MSNERTIELQNVTKATIEVAHGDLRVQGWGRPGARFTWEDDIHVRQDDQELFLQFHGDGELYLPHDLDLAIVEVYGDLVVNNMHNGFDLSTVHGDANLDNLGTVNVSTIQGDLRTHHFSGPLSIGTVEGDLNVDSVREQVAIGTVNGDARLHIVGEVTIGTVQGDVTVRETRGTVAIETVGGDLRTSQLFGDCRTAVGGDLKAGAISGNLDCTVGGDAVVRVMPQPQQAYRIKAGGDITCRLSADANVAISASAGGEIRTKGIPVQVQPDARSLQTVLGNGSAALELTAGGDVSLVNRSEPEVEWEFNFDAENFGEFGDLLGEFGNRAAAQAERIAQQVEVEMNRLTERMDEKFAKFGDGEEFATKIQAKVQSAMQRAEEKINEAMHRAEERAHEAEQRFHERQTWRDQRRQSGRGGPIPPVPPVPPVPPTAPEVSGEERMMILKMLSEGQITVEQADQLLAALGGKTTV